MKKGLITSLIIMIFLTSCSGLLWDAREPSEMTLSISNPFYQPGRTASTSRALALQGQYYYIELALINDPVAYNADVDKAVSGDGTWTETSWGAHAIVTVEFSLSSLSKTIEATFKGVPVDQELQARVLVDVNKEAFLQGIEGLYGTDGYPVCQTYNPVGTSYEEKQWVTLSVEDMSDNLVVLPIRPYNTESSLGPIDIVEYPEVTESYIDLSTASYTLSEPHPGETSFSTLDFDLTLNGGDPVKNIASYLLTEANFTVPTILPAYAMMYDELGQPVNHVSGDSYSIIPLTSFRSLMIGYPIIDNSYQSSEMFIGSTVTSLLDLTELTYPSGSFNISYGIIYDNNASISNGHITWQLPIGFQDSDLDFRIFQTVSSGLINDDVITLDQILALDMKSDSGWIDGTGSTYNSAGTIDEYNGQYIIILAKPAGADESEQFIFSKNPNIGA